MCVYICIYIDIIYIYIERERDTQHIHTYSGGLPGARLGPRELEDHPDGARGWHGGRRGRLLREQAFGEPRRNSIMLTIMIKLYNDHNNNINR